MTPAPADAGAPARAPLHSLPGLLRDEPALAQVLGRTTATIAVPEAGPGPRRRRPGRPHQAAADRGRRPHPHRGRAPGRTTSARTCGDDAVELFPAWETLPFERVSPSVETMGRRLRVLWRLREPDRRARGGGGAGPGAGPAARPARRGRRADRRPARASGSTATSWSPQLVARRLPPRGAGRAPRRGRRARLDRRRVPVDRRPPGAHRPVGRRGRPPDRVLGQPTSARPATSPRRRDLPVPRAAADRRGARAGRAARRRASRGAASSGSGSPRARRSTAWSRGCRG